MDLRAHQCGRIELCHAAATGPAQSRRGLREWLHARVFGQENTHRRMRRASLSLPVAVIGSAAAVDRPARRTRWDSGVRSNASYLGQPLNFAATVRLDGDETLPRECVSAEVLSGEIAPAAGRACASRVEPGTDADRAHWSASPRMTQIDEPVVTVTVTAGCMPRLTRSFVTLIDPPGVNLAAGRQHSRRGLAAAAAGRGRGGAGRRDRSGRPGGVGAAAGQRRPHRSRTRLLDRAPPRRRPRRRGARRHGARAGAATRAQARCRSGGGGQAAGRRAAARGRQRSHRGGRGCRRPARRDRAGADACSCACAAPAAAPRACGGIGSCGDARARRRLCGERNGGITAAHRGCSRSSLRLLREESQKTQQALATLQASLNEAQASRYSNPLVYGAGLAVGACWRWRWRLLWWRAVAVAAVVAVVAGAHRRAAGAP